MLRQAIIDQCRQDLCNIGGFERTELTLVEEGYAECRAYPGPDCVNDVNTVHGGFLLALADQAAATACDTLGTISVTLNMSASFFRPGFATDEYIDVKSRVTHAGRTTLVAEVEMFNPAGKHIFKGTFTEFLTDIKVPE